MKTSEPKSVAGFFDAFRKMPGSVGSLDDIADSQHVPVQFGAGQNLSPNYAPWFSAQLEAQAAVLGVHARKRPDPPAGGFPPTIRESDSYHEKVDSDLYEDEALPVPSPELGRQINIEQMELRMQLPHVGFVPFPALTKSFRAASANSVFTLNVPENAQLVRFSSTANLTWVGRYPFTLPLINGDSIGDGAQAGNYLDPICNPGYLYWLYCAGIKQLYVGIEAAGEAVSAAFYTSQ